MFTILGNDGKQYGPVSADVMRQWIAERRANAQTMVQADGSGEFKPLSQFPEFQPALAAAATAAPGAGAPFPGAPASGSTEPVSNGLAVTSMVLGILSFCLPIVGSIAAIVTGHLALGRARREPTRFGGKGMATAGLVMGYLTVSLVVPAFFAGLTLPALAKAKAKAQRINCVSNMKQISLAALMYANDNKQIFPPTFLAMSNELFTPKILVCPADSNRTRAMDWYTFSETENVTYEFLHPAAKEQDVSSQTVFRCPIHNNVGLGDGSVRQLPGGQLR